jgi:putative RecB family exonuclease
VRRDPFAPVSHRSVSQIKQYERCPYSYYLSRIRKAWQRPAAWLPQGSAVHGAIEWWERTGRTGSLEDAQAVFTRLWVEEVGKYTSITPNMTWWSPSGPYDGEADLRRRYAIGLDQVRKYIEYYRITAPREVIWIAPDGSPGIELGFDIDLDGIKIRGFIDAVIQRPTGPLDSEVVVRDAKTGNTPGDDTQLGVYAVAVSEMFGVPVPTSGDYWMGRSGKPTHPFDLRDWDRDRVGSMFSDFEDKLASGSYPPLPETDKCKFCDVSYTCEYAEG